MIREKFKNLLSILGEGALEREEAIGLSLLSAAAGESIFLLGLPGVAKSMIARRLSLAFRDARRFEYLMSRFSTPDEIFGPVSISKLKDCDSYERVTDGYLPSSEVVFLDEIWKAGPAIQNSLLTAINEKIFRNGNYDMNLPLRVIIAASNELPAEGEGLEALWDRFLIRYIVSPLKDKGNFFSLLTGETDLSCSVPSEMKLTPSEMDEIMKSRDKVEIPSQILEFMYSLRSKYSEDNDKELEEDSFPYVSDRRWKKIAALMRTSACLNGRDAVDWSDCLLLEHLVWDKDSQVEMVRGDIAKALIASVMKDTVSSANGSIWKKSPSTQVEARFWSPDQGVHFAFEAAGELMYISAEDYNRICRKTLYGSFDKDNTVRVSEEPAEFTIRSMKPGSVTINSFSYPLRLERGSSADGGGIFFNEIISSSNDRIEILSRMVDDNIFTRSFSQYKELAREAHSYQGAFNTSRKGR